MADQFEPLVIEQRFDIAARAGEKIIDTNDLCAGSEQPVAQMRTEKAGTACHQNAFFEMHRKIPELALKSACPERIQPLTYITGF